MSIATCLFYCWRRWILLANIRVEHISDSWSREGFAHVKYAFYESKSAWISSHQKEICVYLCQVELTVTTLPHIMRLWYFVKEATRSTRAGRLPGAPVSTKHWGLNDEKFRRSRADFARQPHAHIHISTFGMISIISGLTQFTWLWPFVNVRFVNKFSYMQCSTEFNAMTNPFIIVNSYNWQGESAL